MITLATAATDPRTAEVAAKQRAAFKRLLDDKNDERSQRLYSWATAEFWRVFRQCEDDDRHADRQREVA